MKELLKDVTFIIPVRIDSIDRMENILTVVKHLRHMFDTNIMILEASYSTNDFLHHMLMRKTNIEYIFMEDDDPIFFRTHYLNIMAKKVETDIIGIWDADVILSQHQIKDAVNQLRTLKADIAYPYNGTFLEMSDIIRRIFIKSINYNFLVRHKNKMKDLYYSKELKGGAILVNRQKYIESGMENETFYGWGFEDAERYHRWVTLGYSIYQSYGCMFHLTHPRDINGIYNSYDQMFISNTELTRIKNSSDKEIRFRFSPKSFH